MFAYKYVFLREDKFYLYFQYFSYQKLLFFFACSESKNVKNKKIYIRFLCQKYKNVFDDFCFYFFVQEAFNRFALQLPLVDFKIYFQ